MNTSIFDLKFKKAFLLFLILNIFLYVFIILFNGKVETSSYNYFKNSHHFIADQRTISNTFNLTNALAQFDAQWYLKIASAGYPKNPTNTDIKDRQVMDGLSYAFFPLYPLSLFLLNLPIQNIEITAFVLANVLLILNFISLYFVISKLKSKELGLKVAFLTLFFPFSIFFRSYFTESLQLLLLIWFGYFFVKSKFFNSSIFLGLLNITKGLTLPLTLIFIIYLLRELKNKSLSFKEFFFSLFFSALPFSLWSAFCYFQTGDPFYYKTVLANWFTYKYPWDPLLFNIATILDFTTHPFHSFHYSKVESVMIIIVFFTIYFSSRKLNPRLWWISFIIFLTPMIVKDASSFSRYQIISFPLFLYFAEMLKNKVFVIVSIIFYLILLFISLYFVNWQWIG